MYNAHHWESQLESSRKRRENISKCAGPHESPWTRLWRPHRSPWVLCLCVLLSLHYITLTGFALFLKMKMAGREKELRYFRCSMKEFLMSNCSRILMYEGLPGYGKSQILMEIEYLSQGENHRWVSGYGRFSLVHPEKPGVLKSLTYFKAPPLLHVICIM